MTLQTTNLLTGADKPKLARADLRDAVQRVIDISTPTGASLVVRGASNVDADLLLVEAKAAALAARADKSEAAKPGFTQRPVYIEQLISGFFGRGMLQAELPGLVSQQTITVGQLVGDSALTVQDNIKFQAGGCCTIKHDNGKYATYFIAQKGSGTLSIVPGLRYPVSAGALIERTWYNQAHPGKFYMRELAQRIASATEISSSLPTKARTLYTTFATTTAAEDVLTGIAGGTVAYVAANNVSQGIIGTPVESASGNAAFIAVAAVNDGGETALFAVKGDVLQVLRFVAMCRLSTARVQARVVDDQGRIVCTYDMPTGVAQTAHQVYSVPFKLPGDSLSVKVQFVATTLPSATSIIVDQIDIFDAPAVGSLVISKPTAKIVGLGDSWMSGDNTEPQRESILTQLALELPNATIINKGVGGNKVQEMLARFDTDVLPYSPEYVIIETGTNDCYVPGSGVFDPNAIAYFLTQLNQLVSRVLAIGARPIIIGMPALCETDTATYPNYLLNDRARLYARYFYERWVANPIIAVATVASSELTITVGTTPAVPGAKLVALNYASATTITNLTGGVKDQEIQLRAMNGNVTLAQGVFRLTGSANVVLTNNSIITLRKADPFITAAWDEVSRSIK